MKNLLLSCFFVFLAIPVFSQWHIGLAGGANYSFWTWHINNLDVDVDFEPAMGWRAAALGEWQIVPMLGVRAEVGTQTKVNKLSNLEFSDMTSTGVYREHYQYWEGSLLLQFSPLKKFRPVYLLAGATAGRLKKAWSHAKGTEGGEKYSVRRSTDITDPIWNRNALAADFGLGANLPIAANSKIKLELRYQQALSNLSTSDNVDASVSPLLLQVGYLHRL